MNDADPSKSIAAVAARIQDQALQLGAERATLARAQADLQDLESLYDVESKKNRAVRSAMLTAVRERHGVELELVKAQEQREERLAQVEKNCQEMEDTQGQIHMMQETWEESVHRVYASHQVQRDIFVRVLEGRIRTSEACTKKRDGHLRRLIDETQRCVDEMESWGSENKKMRVDMEGREKGTEAEDEEVAHLAGQVRETITERNALRREIQSAKEKLQEATTDMLRWEDACVDSDRV